MFWLQEELGLEVIIWKKTNVPNNPFIMFHHELKTTKSTLTKRSKENFCNTFKEIATLKEVINITEKEFEEDPLGANREKICKA